MKKVKIIIYDFDGTLTPYPVTKFGIFEKCGVVDMENDPGIFEKIKKFRIRGLEEYDAIYSGFLEFILEHGFDLTDENMSLGAEKLEYNEGVFEYLEDISKFGVKNYLLSSGIKVLLDKTIVSKFFTDIYATTFRYDENNQIIGTDYLMSDKKKVDIIKKIMDENNLTDCRDIIYIGDGLTDLYAMEFVKKNGGNSVFVYLDEQNKSISVAKERDVVSFFAYADYSSTSELRTYITKLCEIGEQYLL